MNINAAEFKAKCPKLIDQVAATHEPLVTSKRGKPVAKLVPIEADELASRYGCMKGTVTFLGDIVSPIDEIWSAESGDENHLYQDVSDEQPAKNKA